MRFQVAQFHQPGGVFRALFARDGAANLEAAVEQFLCCIVVAKLLERGSGIVQNLVVLLRGRGADGRFDIRRERRLLALCPHRREGRA